MFSIPLNNVLVSGTTVTDLKYDYSGNTANNLVMNNIDTITAISQSSQKFNTPIGFIRMNFLPLNNFFASVELNSYNCKIILLFSFILPKCK